MMPLTALLVAGIVLAGERVQFDPNGPRFTSAQVAHTSSVTRAGLARWAATAQGRKLIVFFAKSEYEIVIVEDSSVSEAGSAPQPGIATLISASDHSRVKAYEIVLNPKSFSLPQRVTPIRNEVATPEDLMAATWAAEMLHVYFYALGISLPHHQRAEFQEAWRAVANDLGFPAMTHGDDDDRQSSARVIVLGPRARREVRPY